MRFTFGDRSFFEMVLRYPTKHHFCRRKSKNGIELSSTLITRLPLASRGKSIFANFYRKTSDLSLLAR